MKPKPIEHEHDDGAETNCRMAHNLGILLKNSNCFAIFFSSILVMSVQISINQVLISTYIIPIISS